MAAAAVLTHGGQTLPLPGLPTHPLLAADSAVLAAAGRHIDAERDYATFLALYDRPPAERGLVRITVFGCAAQPPRYLRAVAAVAAPGGTSRLTRRELEILGSLVEDWADPRIAAALRIPVGTIGGHLESIQLKLAVPDRTSATLRALREGLYVPTQLARITR
jgi:DNA-binding CsgD family transcriptional regulator